MWGETAGGQAAAALRGFGQRRFPEKAIPSTEIASHGGSVQQPRLILQLPCQGKLDIV